MRATGRPMGREPGQPAPSLQAWERWPCLRFQWGRGESKSFLTKKPPSQALASLVGTRGHSLSPPRIPYAAKRSPFPPNIWGAPATCRRITVSNWQWSTLFSSGKMGSFCPGRTADAVFRSALPPLLSASPSPVTSIAVPGDTLYGTHPTTLIPRRPSTAPQATRSPKVV